MENSHVHSIRAGCSDSSINGGINNINNFYNNEIIISTSNARPNATFDKTSSFLNNGNFAKRLDGKIIARAYDMNVHAK